MVSGKRACVLLTMAFLFCTSFFFTVSAQAAYRWHTFYGQIHEDIGKAIAVDGSGNLYIAGQSANSFGPGTWTGPAGQQPLHPHSGGVDIMITKLNSSGEYQWHTFYGDPDRQWANGIAVDGNGNVYVTGFTDGAQWLGDGNAAPVRLGQSDGAHIVVLKLDTNGAYQWHTFYGDWVDEGNAIAVDGSGNVYVTGYSNGQPSGTWSDMPAALHAHSGSGYDTVVMKLNTSGAYQWHTFYGASGDTGYDEGNSIAVDTNGNVYITGESDITWGTPIHAHSNPGDQKPDIFVMKLNTDGGYQWHTFYGATYASPYWATGEIGYGIALDGSGNVYVTGESVASWQGDGSVNPIHAYSGARDITVLKLNTNGAYQWHTFYGSAGNNYGRAIAVNGNGSVFVAGDGYETWLGDGNTPPRHPHGNSSNMMVLKLDSNGAYRWHTFYGTGGEHGYGIVANGMVDVYVTGDSGANWLGDGNINPLHASTGGPEITVLKLSDTRVLDVARAGTGSGSLTSVPAGIDCGLDCSEIYDYGTVVTVTASAAPLSFLSGWTNCPNAVGKKCIMTMDMDRTVTATFEPIMFSGFGDVLLGHWADDFIYALLQSGITGGCGNGNYCPGSLVTRGQMAVFILSALEQAPNVCSGGTFNDVNSALGGFCGFIEKFASLGITGGCGGGNYCPNDPVTRGQMAVFLTIALQENADVCSGGTFSDVNSSLGGFCGFIEKFASLGITGGCGTEIFCPDNPVTRDQMAVFLTKGFLQ